MLCNIQVLRAAAAAMVLVHHLRDPFLPALPWLSGGNVGAAGVDIFFVISGFIIMLSAAQRPLEPGRFLVQRAVRIVPLYWLFLLVAGAMLASGLRPIGISDADATAANLLRSMLFLPFERSHGALMPLIGVGWTLNFEAFFYLLFGAALLLPAVQRLPAISLALAALPLAGWLLQPTAPAARFFTNAILLEFLAGCWLAHWYLQRGPAGGRLSTGWLLLAAGGLGFAVPALLGWGAAFSQLMPERVLVFGLPALCIVAGALCLERAGQRCSWQFLQLQGAASYALYLSHTLVLQTGQKLLAATGLDHLLGAAALAGLLFALAVAAGTAVHLWIELPLTGWVRRRLRARPQPVRAG